MIDYQLEGLHPTYAAVVRPTLENLLDAFQACPLHTVKMFRGRGPDRSLANADEPGTISLNSYWFADRPLEALREEARHGYLFCLPGSGEVIKWHGGMVEPQHLLAHEFGHVLSDVTPGWREWAELAHRAATNDPGGVISGYAMAGVDEFWAECFAGMYLGLKHPACVELRGLLGGQ